MTETNTKKPSLSTAIHSKLNALRRAVGKWLFVRGLSIVLLWFVLLLLADVALDWFFPMDLSQRVVVLVIILAILAYQVVKYMVRPMIGSLDDDTLALRVEAGHKELGQKMISALQFARVADPEKLGVSPAMVNATIEQGNDVVKQVQFDDVLDRKVFNRNLTIAIVMLLAIGGGAYGVIASDVLGAWFKRNVLLADVRYPRETFFDLDEVTEITIPRGDDWVASVYVTGVIPDNIYLDFEPLVGSSITQQMVRQNAKVPVVKKPVKQDAEKQEPPAKVDVKPDPKAKADAKPDVKADVKPETKAKAEAKPDAKDEAANPCDSPAEDGKVESKTPVAAAPETPAPKSTAPEAAAPEPTKRQEPVQFTTLFKNVLQPFRFRVRGDDRHTVTHWITVKLVDRPSIESFKVTLQSPKYTKEGPAIVWALDSPTVVKNDENKKGDDDRGEGAQRRASGSSSVYALKGSTITLEATSNKPLSKAVLKTPAGTTELPLQEWTTSDEKGNPITTTRFTAAILPKDLANATYAIELFDTSSTPLVSKRPTRFNVRIKPDRDPVVKAQLRGISSMIVHDARIPIHAYLRDDYHIINAAVAYRFRGEGEDAGKGEGKFDFDQLKFNETKFSDAPVKHEYDFEVIGLKLKEGMSLSFLVEAMDNDDISGPTPGKAGKIGKSPEFYVRVVSEQELREDLIRREQEQRMEFDRLIRAQEDLITETRVAISQTDVNVPDITPEVRQQIMQTQKRQKLAGDRCIQIAKQYENLRLEVLNNKLEDENGPIPRRMTNRIINPLNRIGKTLAPNAAVTLDAARKAPDGAARMDVLKRTVQQQEAVLVEMKDVLLAMNKWSSYQEAVTLMYQVLSLQGKVNRETVRTHQKRIQSIFGDGNKGDDKKDGDKKD